MPTRCAVVYHASLSPDEDKGLQESDRFEQIHVAPNCQTTAVALQVEESLNPTRTNQR